jgi:ectoine hydroxylase-related dioxygenase (phytanoyl-CoA dioxygenase family)
MLNRFLTLLLVACSLAIELSNDDQTTAEKIEGCAAEPPVPAVLRLPDIPRALRSGDALRDTPWLERGSAQFEAGRLSLAAQHLVMSAHAVGYSGEIWGNLGLVLTDAAEDPSIARSAKERVALLCEAESAIELGVVLGADPVEAGQAATRAELVRRAGCASADDSAACVDAACTPWVGGAPARERLTAARRALAALNGGGGGAVGGAGAGGPPRRHLAAVELLCTPASRERLTVELRAHEVERQALSAASALQIWALFRVCGVVAIGGVFGARAVESARNATLRRLEEEQPAIERYRSERQQQQQQQQGQGRPARLEGVDVASRDLSGADLRYEIKIGEAEAEAFVGAATAAGGSGTGGGGDGGGGSGGGAIVDNELLLAANKLLLHGNRLQIDTFSAVVSLPGCPLGHWHSDLRDPRDETWALVGSHARHAPPPGLVTIVPTRHLSDDAGPTGFLLGSHVQGVSKGNGNWWMERQESGDPWVQQLQLAPTAEEGSAILFDLRLRHRGGANRSPAPRPILYVGYTMQWFRDAVNFKQPHTARWDEQPSRTRRALFARVDSHAYTKRLEAELEARGVDVAALRSKRDREYVESSLVV